MVDDDEVCVAWVSISCHGNQPLSLVCRLPGNTPKNRYKDVICYDETRVHLKGIHGQDDYIHANYVDGFKKPKAFILTQGNTCRCVYPLPVHLDLTRPETPGYLSPT